MLFRSDGTWIKHNGSLPVYDVTMGSYYDGAKVCELVGLFHLHQLQQLFGKENIGLYGIDTMGLPCPETSIRTLIQKKKEKKLIMTF